MTVRCEVGNGWDVNDEWHQHLVWHQPPYALSVHLLDADDRIQNIAVISTRGSFKAFQERIKSTTARLAREWRDGVHRGDWDHDPDDILYAKVSLDRSGLWNHRRAYLRDKLYAERWAVGASNASLEDLVEGRGLGTVDWLPPEPDGSCLADPFPWNGRLLCEQMPLDGGKGRIVTVDPGCFPTVRPVLDNAHHHSYPSLYQEEGKTYFLPEDTERGATTLYRLCDDRSVKAISTIGPGRRLGDPTLFMANGVYWIACTDLDVGLHDNLCLLWADTIRGPWWPHKLWPVRIDIRGARSAGPVFRIDGQLHRPGQDCAETYGAGIVIHRVEHLSKEAYRERVIRVLRPDRTGPCPDGLHTLSHDGERCWVDGKRFVTGPRLMATRALRRLGFGGEQ